MTLREQAARRVALARQMGCEPRRWIATSAAAVEAGAIGGDLLGIPIEIGEPRSEWGLDLINALR